MKTLPTLIFIFLAIGVFSQPGGGGGITIKHVYNTSGQEIDIENSMDYTLNCYLLGDTLLSSKNVYTTLENLFQKFKVDSMGYVPDYRDSTILIPAIFTPFHDYKAIRLAPVNSIEYPVGFPYDNFRLMLSTSKDTMVLDFIKTIGENAYGIESVIDSISFEPGYFQYKKREVLQHSYPTDTFWNIVSFKLDLYAPLITNEQRFLGQFELDRINEQLKQLDDRKKVLKKSDEWKLYDAENKKYLLGELEKYKNSLNDYRKKLLDQKLTFRESRSQD